MPGQPLRNPDPADPRVALAGGTGHPAGRDGQMWIGPGGISFGADATGIVEVLCRHGLDQAPVGVLGPGVAAPWHSGPVTGGPMWGDVLARLPHMRFKPVDRSFLFATVCLSEEELAVARYCAAAGEAAARAMAAAAAPGVTETEVCAAGTAAALSLGCPVSMLMWSGPGFAAWEPPCWSCRLEPPRALGEGDVLLADVTTRFGMSATRHQAAIAIGDPHPDIETAAVIARASYQAGLRAARVGNTFGDMAEAMLVPLKQAGSWHTRPLVRMLSVPGPAGGELPLAPGMCCAVGPSAVVAGRAVSLGGTVLIGEDNPIELSPFTARMLRVPAARRPASPPPRGYVMIEIGRAARYDTPAGAIFAVITEPAGYPAWQPGVESAGLAGQGPVRQGSRVRQVRMVMGRRTEIALTITQLMPAELVTLATGPGATPAVRETYRLRPDGDGCRLEFRFTLDGIPAMAEHLARAQLTRQIEQMLERLATIAASRQPACRRAEASPDDSATPHTESR